MKYCECMKPMKPKQAIGDILDEFREFIQEPSRDEASDIIWGFGRLIAGLFGKVYFSLPGDNLHRMKVEKRMLEHNCVRSKNHPTPHMTQKGN